MEREVQRTVYRHGLAFYGTLAFVASFFGARLFATQDPTVVVVREGIHFHHFWYGLAMIVSTGWLGIALYNPKLSRQLAIVFGLGAGLIGDEVGLLLTFGDYYSNLTEVFFVGAIGFIILVTLLSRAGRHIQKDVFELSPKEKLTQIGVFLGAFSAIFFAAGNWELGFVIFGLGVLIFLLGFEREKRPASLGSFFS